MQPSESQQNEVEQAHEQPESAAQDQAFASDELVDETLNVEDGEEDPQSVGNAASGGNVEQELAAAKAEVLRLRAELENFRKRMQRESEQQLKYASMSLIRDLLEVLDNLQRAIDSAKQEATDGTAGGKSALLQGVEMVLQQMTSVFGKHGCQPIQAIGSEFDPNYHEAISQMPSEEFEAGKVAQEVAIGYRLHDRVARPSQVIVSTGSQG